jgi:hypothetical protein
MSCIILKFQNLVNILLDTTWMITSCPFYCASCKVIKYSGDASGDKSMPKPPNFIEVHALNGNGDVLNGWFIGIGRLEILNTVELDIRGHGDGRLHN